MHERNSLLLIISLHLTRRLIYHPFEAKSLKFQSAEMVVQLLLMKRGGEVIYMGPLGDCSHKLVEYFEVHILLATNSHWFSS
jgi:hypothetical protein